ncbi:MAG: AEC family transporter [Promethearchaeota archaeon]
MSDVNLVFGLSLTIILIGYIIKKLNIVSEEEGKGIAKIILNITLPALILSVIPKIEFSFEYFYLTLICLIYSGFILLFGFIIFRNLPYEIKGVLLMTIIGFNIGLFAYPLINGIYGTEGIQYIALFDFGNAFIIFVVIYIIAAKHSPKQINSEYNTDFKYIGKRLLTSVPLLSYIIAIFLNFLNISFPTFISDLLSTLSNANTALTLLLLGIYLNFKFKKSEWKLILKVLAIRYGLGLITGIILFLLLPFNLLFRTILLISLTLPIGMAVVPFAVEYEHDEKLTGIIVNLTIIISFFLMWIIVVVINV